VFAVEVLGRQPPANPLLKASRCKGNLADRDVLHPGAVLTPQSMHAQLSGTNPRASGFFAIFFISVIGVVVTVAESGSGQPRLPQCLPVWASTSPHAHRHQGYRLAPSPLGELVKPKVGKAAGMEEMGAHVSAKVSTSICNLAGYENKFLVLNWILNPRFDSG
jgi:hypothetical protein